jgi:hypothetical protein
MDQGGMSLWFPRRSFHGGRTIDAFSFDTLPAEGELLRDPASVRFRSIAEIMLRGIHRCVAADRELQSDSELTYKPDESVLDNLGDSLPDRWRDLQRFAEE